MSSKMFSFFISYPKLSRLNIKNYRSFNQGIYIENKPLTMIFGGNSAGKSSILKLYSYLEAAANASVWNVNDTVNLIDLIYQKRIGNQLTLKYSVDYTFESDVPFEGKKKHDARYHIYVELELQDIEASIDNTLLSKFIVRETFENDNKNNPDLHEKIRRDIKKYKLEKLNINDLNRYDFVEKRIIIEEEILSNKDVNKRTLLDLSFYMEDGTSFLGDGYINPYTPLTLNHLGFNDRVNMSHRLNDNINRISKDYEESFIEYCNIINSIDIKDTESATLGFKNEVYKKASGYSYSGINNYFNKMGPHLYQGTGRVLEDIARYFGYTDPLKNKIVLPNHVTKDYPGKSYQRHKKKFFKRTALFGGSFSKNIREICEAPFKKINALYLAGIREVLTNNNKLEDFCGIVENSSMIEEGNILESINRYLGTGGLETGYVINYRRGIDDDEIDNLKKSLANKGFSGDDLYNTFVENGMIHRYELYDAVTETPVKKSEVGLGIVQVLPIVANMAAHENALIIIEQPELHLHPAQQSKLAQLMIENHRTHQNRFMIETHSEHFIKTLQLEIAKNASAEEPSLTKDDVQILYCNKSPDHKGSTLRKIELTADGSFAEPWPDNFFDVSADITLERLRLTNRN